MVWVNVLGKYNGLKIKKSYIASVMMVLWHLCFATTQTKTDINGWHSEKIETLDIKEFLNMLPPLKVSGPHAVLKQLVAIIWDLSRKTNNCRTGHKMKECYIAGGQGKSN